MILAFAGIIAGCTATGPTRHTVDIRDMNFATVTAPVAMGDTIVWTNHDPVPHTVTATDGTWSSAELGTNDSFTMVVRETQPLEYLCRYHPTMTGRITINH